MVYVGLYPARVATSNDIMHEQDHERRQMAVRRRELCPPPGYRISKAHNLYHLPESRNNLVSHVGMLQVHSPSQCSSLYQENPREFLWKYSGKELRNPHLILRKGFIRSKIERLSLKNLGTEASRSFWPTIVSDSKLTQSLNHFKDFSQKSPVIDYAIARNS